MIDRRDFLQALPSLSAILPVWMSAGEPTDDDAISFRIEDTILGGQWVFEPQVAPHISVHGRVRLIAPDGSEFILRQPHRDGRFRAGFGGTTHRFNELEEVKPSGRSIKRTHTPSGEISGSGIARENEDGHINLASPRERAHYIHEHGLEQYERVTM